jgi:hypothetical protein
MDGMEEYRGTLYTSIKMSTNNITIVMKQQIVTALKQIWSKMDTKSSPDAVAQEMFAILFPEDSAVPKDDSDKESTSSKRSEAAKARWANKSEEEKEAAKAKLAAGRAAAKAKKAGAQEVPKEEKPALVPVKVVTEPAEPPAKPSRSDAAKARWAAMSEEDKQAAKDKLAAGRAAKKAAKEEGAHV